MVYIGHIIPHAATLDQLHAPTLDGHPDENASDNCVPASIAEGLRMLTGRTYDPDELKDAVYGQGYTGFQAAAAYVHYCHAAGVLLAAYNTSNQSDLIARLRHEVMYDHPVVVTMPSQWGTAPSNPLHPDGYTHVGLAVGIGGTTGQPGAAVRVMNPWHGFMQDELDDWWAQRLCYGQIWIMSKIEAPVAVKPVVAPVIAHPAPVVIHAATPPGGVTVTPAPAAAPAPAPVTATPVAAQPPQPVSVPPAPPAPSVAPVSAPETQPAVAPASQPAPKGGKSMPNPFSIFARAAANVSLTPGERAFLKLAKGVLFTAVVAALGVAMPLISSGHFTLSAATVQAIIGAGAVAGLAALEKLFSAKGDQPLS